MADFIDIHVVGHFDSKLNSLRKLFPKALAVRTVKDMVQQIINFKKSNGDKCIRRLYIHGHGMPGLIIVSGDSTLTLDNFINGNVSTWGPELKKLIGLFCEDGVVVLNGCWVGAGQKGADKLFVIAKFLNVEVTAPTGLKAVKLKYETVKNWWGRIFSRKLIKVLIQYEKDNKWQTAKPAKKPAPIKIPDSYRKKDLYK